MTPTRMLIAAITLAAVTGVTHERLTAAPAAPETPVASATQTPSDRWLDGLRAPYKQLFDAPSPEGGIPLVHVMNYYDTYNKAYGVKDADIDGVLTFYGASTFYGLDDAAWAKYGAETFAARVAADGHQAGAHHASSFANSSKCVSSCATSRPCIRAHAKMRRSASGTVTPDARPRSASCIDRVQTSGEIP